MRSSDKGVEFAVEDRSGLAVVHKRVGLHECQIHSLVFATLPHLTSEVVRMNERLDELGAFELVTLDLRAAGYCRLSDYTAKRPLSQVRDKLTDAIDRLAALHGFFEGRPFEFQVRQIGHVPLPTVRLEERLRGLNYLYDLSISEDEIRQVGKVMAHYELLTRELRRQYPNTLVHGDWHQQNILCSDDDVRFIDWGSAGVGVPQWDLTMLDKAQVERYLSSSRISVRGPEFIAVWRACVVQRMGEFLDAACATLANDLDESRCEAMTRGFPVWVSRMVLAAES